jgi:hypothetical protein
MGEIEREANRAAIFECPHLRFGTPKRQILRHALPLRIQPCGVFLAPQVSLAPPLQLTTSSHGSLVAAHSLPAHRRRVSVPARGLLR